MEMVYTLDAPYDHDLWLHLHWLCREESYYQCDQKVARGNTIPLVQQKEQAFLEELAGLQLSGVMLGELAGLQLSGVMLVELVEVLLVELPVVVQFAVLHAVELQLVAGLHIVVQSTGLHTGQQLAGLLAV